MKTLAVVGTIAMFTVGGGILTHGIPVAHHQIEHLAQLAGTLPGVGGILQVLAGPVLDALFGVVAGAIILAMVTAGQKLTGRSH